jgi:hypothetical protein
MEPSILFYDLLSGYYVSAEAIENAEASIARHRGNITGFLANIKREKEKFDSLSQDQKEVQIAQWTVTTRKITNAPDEDDIFDAGYEFFPHYQDTSITSWPWTGAEKEVNFARNMIYEKQKIIGENSPLMKKYEQQMLFYLSHFKDGAHKKLKSLFDKDIHRSSTSFWRNSRPNQIPGQCYGWSTQSVMRALEMLTRNPDYKEEHIALCVSAGAKMSDIVAFWEASDAVYLLLLEYVFNATRFGLIQRVSSKPVKEMTGAELEKILF